MPASTPTPPRLLAAPTELVDAGTETDRRSRPGPGKGVNPRELLLIHEHPSATLHVALGSAPSLQTN